MALSLGFIAWWRLRDFVHGLECQCGLKVHEFFVRGRWLRRFFALGRVLRCGAGREGGGSSRCPPLISPGAVALGLGHVLC